MKPPEVAIASTAVRSLQWKVAVLLAGVGLGGSVGCASTPLIPFSTNTPPLSLAAASANGVTDQRARFREIFCALNAEIGPSLPDHRPCDEALTRLDGEEEPSGQPVELQDVPEPTTLVAVLGLGANCVQNFLRPDATIPDFLKKRGFGFRNIEVDGLSSSEENAVAIRDAFRDRSDLHVEGGVILVGYSKGIVDILVALAEYPEIQPHVRAVVSIAGAVGGSPLADAVPAWLVRLFKLSPEAECRGGDLKALHSLRPGVRQRWLAENPLPTSIPFYSLVTFPSPDRISNGLEVTYEQLSQVDPRNDSQLIFYDQVVPGSRLLGYVNADHLAIVLPIERAHPWLAELAVDKNAFPREVLIEAVLRHVQEDLSSTEGARTARR